MPSITQRYESKPLKWNLSIVITLGGLLWAATAYFVHSELATHSNSVKSHPSIVSQLDRLEANQVSEKIEKMDSRICDDPKNAFYRSELRKLITTWENLTGTRYPTQLLRCSNDRSH